MKKIMKCLFVALTVTSIFICCNKEEEKQNDPNPYAGTSWVKSFDSFLYIISFAEDTYQYYTADQNGNYRSSLANGPYAYDGNEIIINHHKINDGGWQDEYLTGATVEGNKLVLHSYRILSGDTTGFVNLTFMKR